MDSNIRYRVSIDNVIDNTHAGLPMLTPVGFTFGSRTGALVAAVLVREVNEAAGGEGWRVVLASHSLSAAHDLLAGLIISGKRCCVRPMIEVRRSARGTAPGGGSTSCGRRLDVMRAVELAERGDVPGARAMLAKHNLSYMAVEVIVDEHGDRKVRQ